MRNGVSVADLKALDVDEAAALLDSILYMRDEESKALSKFLKSPKGKNIQGVIDISNSGKPY